MTKTFHTPTDPAPDATPEQRKSYLLMLEYLANQKGAPSRLRAVVRRMKSEAL